MANATVNLIERTETARYRVRVRVREDAGDGDPLKGVPIPPECIGWDIAEIVRPTAVFDGVYVAEVVFQRRIGD